MVDAIANHEIMSFFYAFSGYNQIKIDLVDEEKNSFITKCDAYCYKVMPFELKYARATNQCLMNKMFSNYIGNKMFSIYIRNTIEVYIDDILIKANKSNQHL